MSNKELLSYSSHQMVATQSVIWGGGGGLKTKVEKDELLNS